MDLSFMDEYIVLIVVAFCMGLGYIIKYSLDFIPNKYIPLIMGVAGIVFNIFCNNWKVTPVIIVGGLISGLSSVGCYEAYKNTIKKKESNDDKDNEL